MTAVQRREAGAVTAFMVLAATALMLLLGLVADGGGRLRALGRAQRVAAEAAREAAETIDVRRGTVVIDRNGARAAAQSYLHAAGCTGTITFIGPRTVRVTATVAGTYVILGISGHTHYEVSGAATATAELSAGGQG